MSGSSAKTIFEFSCYRSFLKDRYWALKSSGRKLSFQQFSIKHKLSQSYLKLVLNKQRHLTLNKVSVVAAYFALTEREQQYLTFLILREQVTDAPVSVYFESILHALRSSEQFDLLKIDYAKP